MRPRISHIWDMDGARPDMLKRPERGGRLREMGMIEYLSLILQALQLTVSVAMLIKVSRRK